MSRSYRATVEVMLKEGVFDPEGETIQRALLQLGHAGIQEVKAGKLFVLEIRAEDDGAAEKELRKACEELLANPVLDRYSFRLEREGESP